MVPKIKKKRQTKSGAADWDAVSFKQPCEICGKEDWCTRSTDDQTVFCRRTLNAESRPGFSFKRLKNDKNRVPYGVWVRADSDDGADASADEAPHASVDDCDIVYSALLDKLPLGKEHRKQLNTRGLDDEQIRHGWYSTWNRKSHPKETKNAIQSAIEAANEHEIDVLTVPGFCEHNGGIVFRAAYGLLIPVRARDGSIVALQVRLDKPSKNRGKYLYVSSKKSGGPSCGAVVHVSAFEPVNPSEVRITEGTLKADIATAHTGTHTISVPGAQMWPLARSVLQQLKPQRVYVALDGDWRTNRTVAQCLAHLIDALNDDHYEVIVETWDAAQGKGIDDVLIAGHRPTKLQRSAVTEFRQNLENLHGEFAPARMIQIDLSAERHVINSQAARALSRSSRLFRFGSEIVRVRSQTPRPQDADSANDGKEPPRIVLVDPTLVSDELSRQADFRKWNKREKRFVTADPPDVAAKFLHQNSDYCNLRPLAGVVCHPVLRRDGSIFNMRGYDTRTTLYVENELAGLVVPAAPSQRQVKKAVRDLKDVVCDFPFADEAGFSAWTAFGMSLLTRHLYDGCTPLFLFEAAKSGTGKGLLIDAASLIVFGRPLCRSAFADCESEVRKTITSHILDGHRSVLFDNVRRRIDSAALEAALTSRTWSDRLLGSNKTMQAEMALTFVIAANNPVLSSDMVRRTLAIRLQADVERPDLRDDFEHENLTAWILENRPRLMSALLTIARGYIRTGCQEYEIASWGSFGPWSNWIRNMIVWADCPDPAATRDGLLQRSDGESPAISSLLSYLASAQQKGELGAKFLARNVIELIHNTNLNERDLAQGIKGAIEQYRPAFATALSTASLGKVFGEIAGRIEGGRRLVADGEIDHSKCWRVEIVNND